MSLKEAIAYIADDELAEVTPRRSTCASACWTPTTASAPRGRRRRRWGGRPVHLFSGRADGVRNGGFAPIALKKSEVVGAGWW